jgi:hypothetical protein
MIAPLRSLPSYLESIFLYTPTTSGNGSAIATPPAKPIVPTRRGRPPEKPVQARVIDACAEHWLASQPKGAQTVRGLRIPGATGTSDLALLLPKKGTLLVVGRSWPHAAAYAHMAGQAVGELAHLLNLSHTQEGELSIAADPNSPAPATAALRARIAGDAESGDVGLVFAVGYTDAEGDAPIRSKLMPVVVLLHRWAAADRVRVKLGVRMWAVRLGDKNTVEEVALDDGAAGTSAASVSGSAAASSTSPARRRKT